MYSESFYCPIFPGLNFKTTALKNKQQQKKPQNNWVLSKSLQ